MHLILHEKNPNKTNKTNKTNKKIPNKQQQQKNLQGVKKNQILGKKNKTKTTKQIYLSLFIHLCLLCHACSLKNFRAKNTSVEYGQYFTDELCNTLCAMGRIPGKSHCIKPFKEITVRHILMECQQTLLRI